MQSTGELLLFAGEVYNQLHNRVPFLQALKYEDYHGFEKYRLRRKFLWPLLDAYGLEEESVQAEIIRVRRDLSDELHHHDHSNAVVMVMGNEVGLGDPVYASLYLTERWWPLRAGAIALIPARVTHGFKVENKGNLYFLSVQSPPIVSKAGDDYIRDS